VGLQVSTPSGSSLRVCFSLAGGARKLEEALRGAVNARPSGEEHEKR
jgi:hypothetical protein